jgi:hypothetical protein
MNITLGIRHNQCQSQSQPRFSAWDTNPDVLSNGGGWEGSHPLPVKDVPKEELDELKSNMELHQDKILRMAACHEIGHFLLDCALANDEKIFTISINEKGGGEVFADTSMVNHRHVNNMLNFALQSRAGSVLEHLIFGKQFGGQHDTANIISTVLVSAVKNPFKLHKIVNFIRKMDRITQAHLQQYNRQTVEALVERLVTQKSWRCSDIQDIVREFKLDQVPSVQMAKREQA